MTAARQERKSYRRCWVFARVLWAVALAAGVGFASPVVRGAAADAVVVNRYTGLAIDGVDPVSYFVDGIPKVGRADWLDSRREELVDRMHRRREAGMGIGYGSSSGYGSGKSYVRAWRPGMFKFT